MSKDARIAEMVDQCGWASVAVEGTEDEAPFVYTIGLCDRSAHPELVVIGQDAKSGYALIKDLVDRIRAGARFHGGQTLHEPVQGQHVAFIPVHRTHVLTRLGYSMAYYRRAQKPNLLRALQVLCADRAGRLPNDPACDLEVARRQPLLDRAMPEEAFRAFMTKYGSTSN